jgi:predicted metal-binding membrane protein
MRLMFVVGTGSVGWMLARGAVMALGKSLANGWFIEPPEAIIGVALLSLASVITTAHVLMCVGILVLNNVRETAERAMGTQKLVCLK